MTLDEINREYSAKLTEIRFEHEQQLCDFLKENNLNGRVIRIRDGKEGKLVTDRYSDAMLYHICFCPIKNNGELSTRADEHIFSGTDLIERFKPKEANE